MRRILINLVFSSMEKQDFIKQDQGSIKQGFWANQFSEKRTGEQLVFDVLFGIVFPVLCFVFDPIVFRSGFGASNAIFDISNLKLLVYVFAALSMMALICWLKFENRLAGIGNYLGGIFWTSAICQK